MRKKTCAKCGRRKARGHRYCLVHKAEYMREWRKTHRLSGEARKRANARSFAHQYVYRGKLKRLSCKECGKPAQMHHEDYSKPLEVTWLCRRCHLQVHGKDCD